MIGCSFSSASSLPLSAFSLEFRCLRERRCSRCTQREKAENSKARKIAREARTNLLGVKRLGETMALSLSQTSFFFPLSTKNSLHRRPRPRGSHGHHPRLLGAPRHLGLRRPAGHRRPRALWSSEQGGGGSGRRQARRATLSGARARFRARVQGRQGPRPGRARPHPGRRRPRRGRARHRAHPQDVGPVPPRLPAVPLDQAPLLVRRAWRRQRAAAVVRRAAVARGGERLGPEARMGRPESARDAELAERVLRQGGAGTERWRFKRKERGEREGKSLKTGKENEVFFKLTFFFSFRISPRNNRYSPAAATLSPSSGSHCSRACSTRWTLGPGAR